MRYFGHPINSASASVAHLWRPFRHRGYDITIRELDSSEEPGAYELRATPLTDGRSTRRWINVMLLVATIASTLYVGSYWYYIDLAEHPTAIIDAWPFALAVLLVLGVHELGHMAMSRYHGIRASLPYFLPVPTIFGTMGAIIKIRDRIPDRTALFDIGVAGPLAGLATSIVIIGIGLTLEPVTAPQAVVESEDALKLSIGFPPLVELLAWIADTPLTYDDPAKAPNPVILAGWLGCFITFLNLLPVGQLDGGHMTRAMLGTAQERLGALVPVILVLYGVFLFWWFDVALHGIAIWFAWGTLTLLLVLAGPTTPIFEGPLDRKRQLVGIATFALGALCFIPVPIEIVPIPS